MEGGPGVGGGAPAGRWDAAANRASRTLNEPGVGDELKIPARVGACGRDTVVAVNARPIERPEQALQTWNELRVASAIVVDYLRDGEPRQLRFEILD